jgi:hypothetical protein
MRGFYIDPYSSKEKTQKELQAYLDLTSPDEPMHPRSKISFADITHQGPYISRGDWHSSDTRGHFPTLSTRYAQDQHVLTTSITFIQPKYFYFYFMYEGFKI